MTIQLDDSTNKQTVQVDRAIVCSAIDGSFSDDRILTLRFHRKLVTLNPDGEAESKPIFPIIHATIADPNKEIEILHRKTLVPIGQKMSQGRLVQALMSLYHAEVDKQNKADAAAAEAAAQQPPAEPL